MICWKVIIYQYHNLVLMNKFPLVIILLGIFIFFMFSSQSFAQTYSLSDVIRKSQQLSSDLASQSSSQTYTIPQWVKNNAKYWSEGSISDSDFIKGIQYLMDNNILKIPNTDLINQLQTDTDNLRAQNQNLQNQLQQDEDRLKQWEQYGNQVTQYQATVNQTMQKLKEISSKPQTIISNGTINWYFSDSKGNRYNWYMPMATYDYNVKVNAYYSTLIPSYTLKLPNGNTVNTYDLHQLANWLSEKREWSKVVDTLYDNAGSDDQFIYEVWYLVAQMTTYNKDITNNNLLPLETLTRGEGDCKDKSILIADLLRSSSHTVNWDIHLVIMDANNPANPQTVNHMIVHVGTGNSQYNIESTAMPENNGLNYWKDTIIGWNVPF